MDNTNTASTASMPDSDSRVPVSQKIVYGVGDLAENLSNGLYAVFFLIFCTDILGVSAGAVGTLLILGRVWDMINDTWVGAWSDRTNHKWGKYRPWIVYAAIPLFLVTILTFWAHPGWSTTAKTIYVYVLYFAWAFAYTCVNIPYTALLANMTSNSKSRASIASWRMGLMCIAMLFTGTFFMPLVEYFGKGDASRGWLVSTCLISVIGIAGLLLCGLKTKENVLSRVETKEERIPIFKSAKMAFSNANYNIVLLGMFVAGIMTLGKMAVQTFYFGYVLGDMRIMSPYMLVQTLMAIAGGFSGQFFCNLFKGKGKAISFMCFASAIAILLQFTVRFDHTAVLFWIGSAIAQYFYYGIIGTMFGCVPDCVEYGTLKTGVRQNGFYSAYVSFWHKAGIAIGSAGAGWMLSAMGYIPNEAVQVPAVIGGINFMMFILPIIISIIMGIAFLFYKLDFKTCNGIVAEVRVKYGASV